MSEYCENCKQMADRIAEAEQERDEYKKALELAVKEHDGCEQPIETCEKYDSDCLLCKFDRAKAQLSGKPFIHDGGKERNAHIKPKE